MARVTVTAFTAARMLQIEQSAIVDGYVQADSLILKTRGDDTIVAGNVRGKKGDKGDPGGVWDATNSLVGGIRLQGNIAGTAETPTITGALNDTVDASLATASTPNNEGWGGGSPSGIVMTLREIVHQVQKNYYALQRTVTKGGDATTLWSGTSTEYANLSSEVKNAPGFIAIIEP